MTAVMVQSLFPVFHDAQGKPLDGGYVYIGMIGVNPETHPVPVYWDAARTIPAAQPIRTIAGFPSRNGSPAAIFTDGDVSVTLRDAGRALVWSALDGQTAQAGFMGQEPVYFFSGSGTSAPIVLPVQVSGPEYLRVFVNGNWLRPGIDFTASGYDLAPAGDFDAWPVGVNNISVSLYRQVSLANITTDDVSYDGGTVTDALDTLLPENVIRLSDYMHPTDLAAAIAGNTAAQDGSRVTASAQAWLDACLAATLAQDGANIIGFADAGIYRTNNRLMTDAFNNMNWSTGGFSRSRLRLRTDGSVRFRLQNWAGGRAALRTDGPYAGSTYIAPIAVFEWFQNTGHQRFGGFEGQWIIEGQDNPNTDPMGFYLYRLNAATFNGELEVTNLRNRNFVWDSIFNTHADYVRSTGSAGVMLTEAGGSGLLAADTTSTVAGVTQRTGLRYTLSGATITINTMVRNETTGTVESSTPASVFTSDHVGKWIGLDRQGRENTIGDNPDDPAEGGSTRRSVRWFQIASVTDASTAVLAVAPSQQGTTGQMVQQNRTFSFEVLKCSVTAGSNTATLSMPVTTSLVGLEVTIPGAHYDGLPARRPHLCAMVTAHSGNTVTLSHAAGVTRSGVPFVVAPQVTIGSLSHTEFLSSSRNCDDFHIARVWCESGQTAAVPLFVQDATNVTIGDESKLHGCPSTNNVNFGANFTCVLAGDFGVRFKGRFTHSRHSREFGMFYIGGDRSEAWIDGELSSWTADDQTAIFYIDPANVASTRIWDVYFNASDYATGFPDASAGQVFERGGPNYTPGRVKAGASQRSPRGERPLWPPVTLPPSRAPWWGSTRADAVSALARGGVVPENGVIYTIGGLEYLGQTGATAIADLPGLTWAGERDIRHFGAESGAADVRAAFVAARDSVPAGQAGKVIVPPGVWNISTSLTANNNNFVEWEIQDGASVLPSVGARISGSTWRINYPRSGAVDRAEIRDKPVVADGNAIGRYDIITNTGGLNETGYGERIGYTSSAYGSGRFDIATAVISQFNRTAGNGGGQSLAQWLVTVSPTTGDGTSGNAWGSFVAEWNIVNRGQDTGFTDRRSNLQNWTGGVQMVIEDDLLGIDPAITKNATFGFMFAGQTPTGNDVDRRRYYAGILGEPNCIAGLTGRALYWTGDTTGQTNRIPLAFLEGAGRWGHGLKLDAGTFDTAAIQMAHGHSIRWGASGTPVTVTGQNGSVEVSGEGFAAAWGSTRSTAVAAIAGGLWTPVNGRTYTIGGLRYRGVTGSTNIPDMPGLVPVDPTPYHYGLSPDGATDIGWAVNAGFAVADTFYIPEIVGSAWAVSTPIFMGTRKKLTGTHAKRSRLRDLTNGATPLITYADYLTPTAAGPERAEIADLWIDELSVPSRATHWTIDMANSLAVHIHGVTINAGIVGKTLTDNYGILVGTRPGSGYTGDAWLARVHGNTLLQAKFFINTSDSEVTGNEFYGYFCDYAVRLGGGRVAGAMVFANNAVGPGFTQGGIWLDAPDGQPILETRIIGNHFDGNDDHPTTWGIYADAAQLVQSCVVVGNTAWNYGEEWLRIENAASCTVADNGLRSGDAFGLGKADIFVRGAANTVGPNSIHRTSSFTKPDPGGIRTTLAVAPVIVEDTDAQRPNTLNPHNIHAAAVNVYQSRSMRVATNPTPERRVALFDDFLSPDGLNKFPSLKGSDGVAALAALESGNNGLCRLAFGTDAGGTMALNGSQILSPAVFRCTDWGLQMDAIVRPSGTAFVKWFVGFTNGTGLHLPITESGGTYTANVTDAVGFLYSAQNPGTGVALVGIGVRNSVLTAPVTLPIVTAAQFIRLRLELDNGGRCTFLVNGTPYGHMTSNAITGTTLTGVYAGGHSTNTGAKWLTVDYLGAEKTRGYLS